MTRLMMSQLHHRLDGHEFEQALEAVPGVAKSWNMAEWLNWTEFVLYMDWFQSMMIFP